MLSRNREALSEPDTQSSDCNECPEEGKIAGNPLFNFIHFPYFNISFCR